MGGSHGLSAPSAVGKPASSTQDPYQAIAAWALRQRPGRLNAWMVGGVVDAVGLLLFLPVLWPLACAFMSLAAVGTWGLAAQRLAAPGARARPRALREIMFAAMVAGTVAAIVGFYGVFLAILGPSWTL